MKHLHLSSSLPLLLHRPSKPHLLHPSRRRASIRNAASGGGSGEPTPAAETASGTSPPAAAKPAGVKDRLKARNQARRVRLDSPPPEVVVVPKKKPAPAASSSPVPKKKVGRKGWEEMSLGEKAVDLYVGEKGLLFWLNKIAYASIFIMVGAWVLFRFVGPSLGLYQLDAPPLPPTAVFSGGSP